MPSRPIPLATGEFYHVFNRGVARMRVFGTARDHDRFIKTMLYYQIDGPKIRFSLFMPSKSPLASNKKIVNIVCYRLMPNHFHFLLRQNREGGISEFLSKLANSYTKYFNTKNKRIGPLFQGEFKAVHVETNEQLIHLSRYIHLNPLVGFLVKSLELYRWSSYQEYVKPNKAKICAKETILEQFRSLEDYKQFVLDQEDYGKKLEMIKHQLIDHSRV